MSRKSTNTPFELLSHLIRVEHLRDLNSIHMHFCSPKRLLFLTQLLHGVSAATVAALAPSKSIITTNQALRPFNEAVGLIERKDVAMSQSSFNGSNLIGPHGINKTLSSSSETLNRTDSLIPFKVLDCPTTLEFHDFGRPIPTNLLLQTMTAAIAVAFKYVGSGNGHKNIHLGWFRYQQPFFDHGMVDFAVGDFREIGRPINYFVLCDILRGIAEFMMLPQYGYHEVRFEVEVKGVGYAASGRVNYTAPVVAVA